MSDPSIVPSADNAPTISSQNSEASPTEITAQFSEEALSRGTIVQASLPDTIEWIANSKPSGLASDAYLHSVAAWTRDLYAQFVQVTENLRRCNEELTRVRDLLDQERTQRIQAEAHLRGLLAQRAPRELVQAGSLVIVGLGYGNLGLSIAIPLIVIGGALWIVAFSSGRVGKQ